jgi:hypothetical protein
VISTGLVVLAAWLGLVAGNALGATYSLIAATLVATRAVDRPAQPAPIRVEVEP